jgi:lipopolysaccharide O-acetyltransferase
MEKLIALLNFFKFSFRIRNAGFFNIQAFPKIKGAGKISLGKSFYANRFLRIEVIGNQDELKLFIGNNVSVGEHVHIAVSNKVRIADHVLMGSRILITDHNHGSYKGENSSNPMTIPQQREIISEGPVIIEENVWIGDGAVILPNVTIGKGSVIGANSVVVKSVPENCIVGGIPAKIIKKYSPLTNRWEIAQD